MDYVQVLAKCVIQRVGERGTWPSFFALFKAKEAKGRIQLTVSVTAGRKMVVSKKVHSDMDNESSAGVERDLTLSRHFFHEERIILLSPVLKIALCGLTHFSTWSKRRILRLIVVNFLSEHKNCFWHEQLIKFMLVKRQHHAKGFYNIWTLFYKKHIQHYWKCHAMWSLQF